MTTTDPGPPSSVVPVVLRSGLPLAPIQRSLWSSQMRFPTSPLQNMALLTHIEAPVDATRLGEAFAAVVAASDALRTRVAADGSGIFVAEAESCATTETIALNREEALDWAEARVGRVIDATSACYDSVILRHADQTVSWYLAMHHLVTDATSSAIVYALTAGAYEHGSVPELDSFYEWVGEVESASHRRVERARAHWSKAEPAPRIARLYRPLVTPSPEAHRVEVPLGEHGWRNLDRALGEEFGAISDDQAWTSMLVTAAAVYVHRLTAADRFAVGVPIHHRRDGRTRRLVGPLMEVFPVDVEVRAGDTYRSLHRRTARALMEMVRHAQPGTAPANQPEVVINVILRGAPGNFGAVPATTRWVHSGAMDASHLVRVHLTAYGGRPELHIDLSDEACSAAQRQRAGQHFATVLDAMVAGPDRPVTAVELCTSQEIEVLGEWETGDPISVQPDGVVPGLRRALAGRSDVVLEDDGARWTGGELWDEVESTALGLRAQGVTAGDRVGVELPRSGRAVVATLAALVAGASYVPLDPEQPAARRRRLAERAGCRVVVDESMFDALRAGRTRPPTPTVPQWSDPELDDEAYLLFTSGSTGEPKGVPITHRGLANYLAFAVGAYTVPGRPPVAGLFSALTFDLTVTGLYVPLLAGGRLVVFETDGPEALVAMARHQEITWCKLTPSHLRLLARVLPEEHRLDTMVVGGESFDAALAERVLRARPTMRIFNEYGPTEAVVGCMLHETDLEEVVDLPVVPIGRPAPGVELRVVDAALHRVPLGVEGELCVAHSGVTSGYLDDPEDSVRSPFVEIDGRRFYRTGDLVRLIDETRLIYVGRNDDQVKVGGVRLEPEEVAAAIVEHPSVTEAMVRLWSPAPSPRPALCVRCGLSSDVPGVAFDSEGVCNSCLAYDAVAPQAEAWFGNLDDLERARVRARARRSGRYDCLHLLSGGKDSTYALYRLVELGFEPYVFTLDNGFISDEAKDNVRRTVEHLGVDHEIATTPAMNDVFRDSLERYSNVCNGCYKTIYTLATTRAVELGIPLIVTGLSRGQLFETRLIPQQFEVDRFDPAAIDRAVIRARRAYHGADDAVRRLLDTSVFDDDEIFERVEYLDFYRYVDVPLAELLDHLARHAPWVRPSDTGRSTNCLINAAGIHTHLLEQGYHNYAVPYAWDVRLGHKSRSEALEELDDELDPDGVAGMLDEVGYHPHVRPVLCAWIVSTPGAAPVSPADLRLHLSTRLPAHAIPAAFVEVDEFPSTPNGKLDVSALPRPKRVHRPGTMPAVEPSTELERTITGLWERILGIEPIGVDDGFFELGGDSLAALEMIVALGEQLGIALAEELAFSHTTPRMLAAAIPAVEALEAAAPAEIVWPAAGSVPVHSRGELAILHDALRHPGDSRYNVGRLYVIDAPVDAERFGEALRVVAAHHQPLVWNHAAPRRKLSVGAAVEVELADDVAALAQLDELANRWHRRRFDLIEGPLLRARLQRLDSGSTAILLAFHHVCGDAASFGVLWRQVERVLHGGGPPGLEVGYDAFTMWQENARGPVDRKFWETMPVPDPPGELAAAPPACAEPDGLVTKRSTVYPGELVAQADAQGLVTAVAAAVVALDRYTDAGPVSVGLLVSTRTHRVARELVGFFLNTIPIEVDVDPGTGLDAIRELVSTVLLERLAHRTHPYAEILDDRRRRGYTPPGHRILLAYDDLRGEHFEGRALAHRALFNGTAVADLTLFFEVRDDRVDLSIEHRGAVVGASTAERLLDDLDAALAAVIHRPASAVSEVMQLTATNGPIHGVDLAEVPAVLDTVRAHIARRPEAPAITCGGTSIDWAELGTRSARLATALRHAGVNPGDRVIVSLPRGVNVIAAILAVLRCGAAYVPIDPAYPSSRRRSIAAQAGARAAITEGAGDHYADVDLSIGLALDSGRPADDVWVAAPPSAEAYVMFTSGTTGQPLGVPVTHANLAASTAARLIEYAEPLRRFLLVSSFAFDSSVAGLFWTLLAGGELVLPTDAEVRDPAALARLLDAHAVTHTLMVPTLYRAVLDTGAGATTWPHQVIVAGEACPLALVRRHHDLRPGSRLSNEYGPTEATVWATVHHTTCADNHVPIGRPVPGVSVVVVDECDRVRPTGVAGELIIGGPGVAPGYLADPARTRAKFGSGLEGMPGRWFRTGDRAVVEGGSIRFLGRLDDQINLGGVRIEPEEIESVLARVDGVRAVLVAASDRRSALALLRALPADELAPVMAEAARAPDPAGALIDAVRRIATTPMQLVALVEPGDGSEVDIARLRAEAAARLPPLWRPVRYQLVDQLPRHPNGKLDRAAAAGLSVIEAAGDDSAGPPVNDLHAVEDPGLTDRLQHAFGHVLGAGRVGAGDSFFDVGGHSLLAVELVLQLQTELGVAVDLAMLYEHPTPAALARELSSAADFPGAKRGTGFLIPIRPEGSKPPLIGVHVLGVNQAFYRPLAEHLGPDRPVYGLSLPPELLDSELAGDVAASAERYLAELDRTIPTGPVHLAGVSLGGLVAFELARRLTERGRVVGSVALFDAPGPDAASVSATLAERITFHAGPLLRGDLDYLAARVGRQRHRLERLRERVSGRVREALGLPSNDRLRLRHFVEGNVTGARAVTFAPWDGRIVVFCASQNVYARRVHEHALGWSSMARGPLEVIEVPGDHLGILAEPNVAVLAALLDEQLERGEAEARSPGPDNRMDVERRLVGALHAGRLEAEVTRLVGDGPERVDGAAWELVRSAERALTDTASHARSERSRILHALRGRGIDAALAPAPPLLARASVSGAVVADALPTALSTLATLGYEPFGQQGGSTGDSLTMVHIGDLTTLVTVFAGSIPAPTIGDPALPSSDGVVAPFLGTPRPMVDALLELADVDSDSVVMDLGCGDGRVVIRAAARHGCRARGVEARADLADLARAAVREHGVEDLVEIATGDLREADLAGVDVVFLFLPPAAVAEILPSLLAALRPGSRVIAHEQRSGDWSTPPDQSHLVVAGGVSVAHIWRVGAHGHG